MNQRVHDGSNREEQTAGGGHPRHMECASMAVKGANGVGHAELLMARRSGYDIIGVQKTGRAGQSSISAPG